ncbi:MAG: hypothetical protein RL722_386 [Pseudomonadota bacterium]|jgi:hypothetical protein
MPHPVALPRRRSGLHLLLAGAAALLLSACANQTITRVADPLKEAPKADESPVVLSITANTAQISGFDTITLERVQAVDAAASAAGPASAQRPPPADRRVLSQILPGLSRDTSVFVGALPAGDYEFISLRSERDRRFLDLAQESRKRLGRFHVEARQPVDLGRLVVTPVNTSVIVGRSGLVADNRELLQRFSPDHARLLAGAVPGWLQPRGENDKVEDYARLRPVGAAGPLEMADGRIVAASRLGSVLERNAGGSWRVISSGRLESILHALPVDRPDTRLIAVGELGTLLRLSHDSDRFEPIPPGDLPPGNLLFIAGNDRQGWYLVHQNASTIRLLRSDRLENGQWQTLRTESVAFSLWSGANAFWSWATPGGLAYAVSEGRLHFLDFASGQWTERSAPNKARFVQITADPEATLGALTSPGGGFAGVFASTWFSRDDGQSWKEVKSEFNVKVAPPRRLPGGRLLMVGGVFSDPELHASDDEGKTWQKVSPFPRDQQLVLLPSGQLLAVALGQFGLFGIRHSSDGGKTWRTEYSNFDRQAFEADEARRKAKP